MPMGAAEDSQSVCGQLYLFIREVIERSLEFLEGRTRTERDRIHSQTQGHALNLRCCQPADVTGLAETLCRLFKVMAAWPSVHITIAGETRAEVKLGDILRREHAAVARDGRGGIKVAGRFAPSIYAKSAIPRSAGVLHEIFCGRQRPR